MYGIVSYRNDPPVLICLLRDCDDDNYQELAFTPPKAVRPHTSRCYRRLCPRRLRLRWSRIKGSGPGHAPRIARHWPVPLSITDQRAVELENWQTIAHACARWPVRTFSKWAILHRFPNLYTLRVEILRKFVSA